MTEQGKPDVQRDYRDFITNLQELKKSGVSTERLEKLAHDLEQINARQKQHTEQLIRVAMSKFQESTRVMFELRKRFAAIEHEISQCKHLLDQIEAGELRKGV